MKCDDWQGQKGDTRVSIMISAIVETQVRWGRTGRRDTTAQSVDVRDVVGE